MTVTTGCGSGHFKYEWSTGATTATVSNVCPGTYSVKVTDLDWPKDTTISFMIPSPASSMVNADMAITGDHCNQTDGSINVTQVHGGIGPYQYALNNQPFGTGSTFQALPKGNYAITIRDNTGCLLQQQAIVQAMPGPEKLLYTKKDAYCGLPAGTVFIDSVRNGSFPYSYALGNAPFSQQTTITNIPPGNHTITVRDNYGCQLKVPLTINQSEALQIAISPKDTSICASMKMTFKATLLSHNEGVQFSWDGGQPATATTFNTAVYADKRMVVLAIDKNGCIASDSAFVSAPYCDTLFSRCVLFPSAFSPNQNGLNDTFGPHLGSCEIKTYKMVIYNRWGQLIFQCGNALNRWNGTINGYAQPSGLYVYSCVWEDALGFVHKHKGTVTLIR
jgi:gliding motility-associated-like protein